VWTCSTVINWIIVQSSFLREFISGLLCYHIVYCGDSVTIFLDISPSLLYQTTQCHDTADHNKNLHCCEIFQFYILKTALKYATHFTHSLWCIMPSCKMIDGWQPPYEPAICWRMVSSVMSCCVALVITYVSEILSAFFIRVTRIGELGITLAVTSNQSTLRRSTN
jgi:hypothetical protein